MRVFKDSGIEWLGEIPEHWKIKPLKAVFHQRSEQNTNLELHAILSLIKDVGVVPYEEKGNIGNKSKEDLQSYKIARINDLILNKMNAVIGSLGVSAYNGLVSPIYLVFYINSPKYLMSYYSYLFQIKNVQKFLKIYAYGIMEIRESIDYLDFKKMSLPVPPLKEQEQIANFLDEKCKKIANFIEKKEKLINLLKEQKQALINETITKGLDKNVNFKDSGIEWLGEIPWHWEVKKLKMLFVLGNGLNITKADFVSYGIPCVSYGEIHSKYPCRLNTTIHTLPFVSKTYLADKPQSLLQKGDFVFADTSEDIEGSGNFTSIQSDTPIFAGYHTIILKYKGKINSLYFSFLFDSIFTRNQIRKEVCGVKVFSITKSILKEVQCLIPPLKEQEQIANFLDEKCEQIANFIEKKEKLISLLKEQKQAFINETITKGLDKNINFKDSGIEHLGEIPQHWKIVKLKYLGSFQNGISINSEAFGAGYPFVSYGDIYNNICIPYNIKGLVNSTEIDRKIYSVKQGDIFFTRTSETIDEIGISSVCLKTIENAVFAGFLIRFRADKKVLDNNFAKFYFRRSFNQSFFAKENGLVTRASLSQELLGRLSVVIPPLKEQEQIAKFLDSEISKIDAIIEKTKKQIKLIKEYKTTLINQAVCGRISL